MFQDLHSVDLEEFMHGGTNITGFRLVDPENTQKVVQEWIYGEQRYNRVLDMGQFHNKVCTLNDIDFYDIVIGNPCISNLRDAFFNIHRLVSITYNN